MEKFFKLTLDMKHQVERAISFRHSALQVLLAFAALLVPQLVLAQTATKPTDGDGTEEKPYFIRTAEELAWFRDEVNNNGNSTACAKLMEDIDLGSVCHAAIDGKEEVTWEPISTGNVEWKGTFDGNGKTISNLYINTAQENIGLFAKMGSGEIKNLNIQKAQIFNNGSSTGILVGNAVRATIRNVKTDSSCSVYNKGNNTGGIVGSSTGLIENCENFANVDAKNCTGGICGNVYNYPPGKIKGCSNYGVVKGADQGVAGICGNLWGFIEDCANYATVQGNSSVGGICGSFSVGEIKNVFTCGNVECQKWGGLVIGYQAKSGTSITGFLFYDKEATMNGSAENVTAVSNATHFTLTKGLSREMLKKGVATMMLQQYAAEGVNWGQNLAEDAFPVLGSTDKVYADGEVAYTCTGELMGTLTNTIPNEQSFKYAHTSAIHHETIVPSCLEDGVKEYYECNDCHMAFLDESMTIEAGSLKIDSYPGHVYAEHSDKCSRCGQEIPVLKLGNNTIQIPTNPFKQNWHDYAYRHYHLLKFIAGRTGLLEANITINSEYRGFKFILFDQDKSKELKKDYFERNTKFEYDVEKGKTYYIGFRNVIGNAVEGDQTLTLALDGFTIETPEGKGTEEAPFELCSSSHLKWFADYVNGKLDDAVHLDACAKLMNDIDLSSVCYPASDGKKEVTWEPISPAMDYYDVDFGMEGWHGIFDGNGKTISNLYINYEPMYPNDNVGFFSYVSSGAHIYNLTFSKAKVKNASNARGNSILVGRAHGAIIENIKVDGESVLEGGYGAGSIVGFIMDSQVRNCENHAAINGGSWSIMGGICGYASSQNASDSGDSDSSTSASRNLIEHCINYGELSGYYSYGSGGIIGTLLAGTMENCANYANIQGWACVGGIAGSISGGTVKNVFTYGNVTIDSGGSGGLLASTCENSTAVGCVAYNKEAKLTVDGTEVETRAFGNDNDKFSEGAENLVAFTTEEIKSGKLTYMLNQGVTDGTQTWYQKLGEGGDVYPLMTPAEGSTVYCLKGYHCDGSLNEDYIQTYNNEGLTRYDEPHDYQEKKILQELYVMACGKCDAYENDQRTIKGFAGEGKDLVVTEEDGTYKVKQLTFTDAEPYVSPVEIEVEEMTYERNFSNKAGKWQALYVPFGFDCTDLSESYEVASINNFHEYLQKNGNEKVVLEVKKLTSGTLQPFTPYVIRLKEGADATLPLFKGGKTLTLLPPESRYIDCFSMTRYYKFTGVLQPKMEFTVDQDFVMNGGKLCKATSDARLSPQRWYLSATDRSSNGELIEQAVRVKSIDIQVVDEGAVTGIEDIYVATDIEGVQSSRQGIYDLQGRKLSVEPTSGVYIKDGKKYVK